MKQKVICYVIIKEKIKNSNRYSLYDEPIIGCFEGLFDMDYDLDNGDDEHVFFRT